MGPDVTFAPSTSGPSTSAPSTSAPSVEDGVAKVVITFTASGDVSDYDAGRRSALAATMARHLGIKSSTFGVGRATSGKAGGASTIGKGTATSVDSVVRAEVNKGTRTVDLASTKGFKRAFKVRIGTGRNAEERWVIDLAQGGGQAP